jgi:hypothetical protein
MHEVQAPLHWVRQSGKAAMPPWVTFPHMCEARALGAAERRSCNAALGCFACERGVRALWYVLKIQKLRCMRARSASPVVSTGLM